MRWVLRSIAVLVAILHAGFLTPAFELETALHRGAAFVAGLMVLAMVDRAWFRVIDRAPGSASADKHHV